MAIVTITADLNGGDQVTPNADLTYKIYNGSDALIGSKGSANTDTDVSVIGDVVTLINVDIGADTIIKITSTNQFGQESVLSDPFTYVPPVNPFDDASVVYSLRDIFGTNNAVIRVRRDSDNAEQDFTATEITDGTLLAFVGGGNGFVTSGYNQNGVDNFTQNISLNQFRIVDNGVLELESGNPTIVSRSTGNYELNKTTFTHLFIVYNGSTNDRLFEDTTDDTFARIRSGTPDFITLRNQGVTQSLNFSGGLNFDNQTLLEIDVINNLVYVNGVSQDNTINLNSFMVDNFFGRSASASPLNNVQELHLFNQSSLDRTEIVNNINNYYNIY